MSTKNRVYLGELTCLSLLHVMLANITCGIQSYSSKHPCCWCDVKSDELKDQGTPRNFRSIRMQCKAFIEKEKGNMMCVKDYLYVYSGPNSRHGLKINVTQMHLNVMQLHLG